MLLELVINVLGRMYFFFVPAPSCNAPSIPDLSYITAARGSQSEYLEDDKVYYSCRSGYELVGIPEIECKNGVWSRHQFTCKRKSFLSNITALSRTCKL